MMTSLSMMMDLDTKTKEAKSGSMRRNRPKAKAKRGENSIIKETLTLRLLWLQPVLWQTRKNKLPL